VNQSQTEKNNLYDVAIVGGGPASFAASIYASHGNLKVVFVEKEVPGGKMTKTQSVQNYPGFENIISFQHNHTHIVAAVFFTYVFVQTCSRIIIRQWTYDVRIDLQIFYPGSQ